MKSASETWKLLVSAFGMRRAVDGMAVAAEAGGDTRALTIILNMRAALDSGDLDLLERWMAVLERHAGKRRAARAGSVRAD